MSFEHLRPKRFTTSHARVSHAYVGHARVGHARVGARVSVGDNVTMPVGPQDQGVFLDHYWQQLNTAFQANTTSTPATIDAAPNVTSTTLAPGDISNFLADFSDWNRWFASESTLSGPQGALRIALPGHSSDEPGIALGTLDLPALNGWYQKALSWRALFAEKFGASSGLPVNAPAGTGLLSGVNQSLSGVTSLLEHVAVLGALGVALWFFWPVIAGARGVVKA